jgi:hypothetical protein
MDLDSEFHGLSPSCPVMTTESRPNSRLAKKQTNSIEDFEKIRQVGEGTYG